MKPTSDTFAPPIAVTLPDKSAPDVVLLATEVVEETVGAAHAALHDKLTSSIAEDGLFPLVVLATIDTIRIHTLPGWFSIAAGKVTVTLVLPQVELVVIVAGEVVTALKVVGVVPKP